jgi:hypothetical protein
MFVSIKGGSYANFQRALLTGNLTLIRAAASELPTIAPSDALVVCMAIRKGEPERYQRAVLRWLARFCEEKARAVEEVRAALAAFERLPAVPRLPLRHSRRSFAVDSGMRAAQTFSQAFSRKP